MALPLNISGLATAIAPSGPFRVDGALRYAICSTNSSPTVTGNTTWAVGQTFITDANPDQLITSVMFAVGKVGAPTDNLVADLHAIGGDGKPTGSPLATSNPVLGSSLLTSAQPTVFTFPTPYVTLPSTTYSISVRRTGANGDATNNYIVGRSTTSVYANGGANSNGATGWSAVSTSTDTYCQIGGTTAYYFFGRDGTTATTLRAWRTTDPTTSWSPVGLFSGFTGSIWSITAYPVGHLFHLAMSYGTGTSQLIQMYTQYNTLTDTFMSGENVGGVSSYVTTGSAGTAADKASLVVRSNGEVVVLFNGTQTKTSGTFYARMYYTRRTGANTWTAPVQVDGNTANDALRPTVVLGANDLVHFIWGTVTGSVASFWQRTLTAANALQTAGSITWSYAASTYTPAVSYDDAGVTKVAAVVSDNSLGTRGIVFTSGNTPALSAAVGLFCTLPTRIFNDGTDLYMVGCLASDRDLYYSKSTDRGATWGASTSLYVGNVSGVGPDVMMGMNGNTYQRGQAFVLPYLVNENGTQWKYNELTLRYLAIADAWNANDKSAAITLSNSDKTATFTATGQLAVRSTQLRANGSAGKYYAEFRYGGSAVADYVGVQKASEGLTTPAEIIYVHGATGIINVGAGQVGSLGRAALTTDVTCMAWDTLAERAWFRFNNGLWNNNATADPATGVGGVDASSMSAVDFALYVFGVNDTGASVTVRTEAAELTYDGPIGFTSWMGEVIPTADAWNILDKAPTVELSNGDKTATSISNAAMGCRSTKTRSPVDGGKFYAEIYADSTPVANIGLASTAFVITTSGLLDTIRVGSNGSVYVDNVSMGSVGAIVAGDAICFAWDFDLSLVWVRKNNGLWNGTAGHDPVLGLGGFSTSALTSTDKFALWFAGGVLCAYTVHTETAEFTQPGPENFLSWMGEELVAPGWPVTSLVGASPVFSIPAFKQIHPLTALPINLSVHSYTTAPIVQRHELGAPIATVGGVPVFGSLLFKQVVPFSTPPLIVAPYVIDVPATMTQTHKIVAQPFAPLWSYTPPAIAQTHVITPNVAAAGLPVFGVTGIALVVPIFADSLTTSAPVIAAADATIRLALAASGFATAGFSFANAVIHEINLLSAANLATGPPVQSAVPWGVQRTFTAAAFATSAPTLAAPALTQRHPCVATNYINTAPTIGASSLAQIHTVTAANLAIPPLTTPGAPLDAIAEGASTHLDLIGKTGYVRGVGSVGVDTLIGDDPNSYWAMGTTAYYPDAHTQYGYEYLFTGKDYPPAPIGALRDDIFSGKSVIFRFQTSGYSGPSRPERFSIYLIPFQQFSGLYIDNYYFGGLTHVEAGGNAAYVELDGATWKPGRPGVVNAVGFTAVEGDRLDLAGNKFDAQTVPLTTADIAPGQPPIVGVLESYGAIASITTFDRLSLADLKAKTSATLYGQAPPLPLPTGSLRQRHILSAPVSLILTPVIPIGFLGQAGIFTPLPIVAGVPTIDVGTLAQRQVLTAAYAAKSPTIGAAVYSKNILPAPLAVTAPTIGTPALTIALNADALAVLAPEIGTSTITKRLAATNLAIGTLAIAAGVLKQVHALATDPLVVEAPAPSIAYMSQAGVFSLVPAVAGDPVFGTAAFNQRQALAAVALQVSSPTINQTDYGRVINAAPLVVVSPSVGTGPALRKVLTPAGFTSSAPVLDATAWLAVSITAADLAPVPAIAAATIKQLHILAGSSIAVLSPVTSPVVLGQAGVLQFMPLVAGQPVFSIPLLKQRHTLAASPAVVELPTIDESAIEQVHALAPAGVPVSAPVLGTPTIGQRHALVAALAPVAPVIATNTLSQAHRLTALPIVVAPYALGVPAIEAISNFEPLDRITSAPAIGAPLFKQRHAFETSFEVGPPELPELTLNIIGKAVAVPVKAGAPVIGVPTIELDQNLVGANLTVGAISLPHIPIGIRAHLAASDLEIEPPASTAPAIVQRHILATTRIMPYPAIGEAQLGQDHSLTAGGLVAGRPVIRAGFFSQAGTMAAVPLWVAPPILPELAPRQRHRLAAIEVEAGAPSLGLAAVGATIKFPRAQSTYAGRFKGPAPVLGQAHQFIAPAVTAGPPRALLPKLTASAPLGQPAQAAAGPPALGAPLMGVSSRLVPVGLRYNYPALTAPQLAQEHVLAAMDLATLGPLFQAIGVGAADLVLDAIGIETAPPVLGEPRPPSRRARLYAIANVTGKRGNHVTITGRRHRTAI